MLEIALDITHTNKVTTCFGNGIFLSSIRTIQFFIPIGTTNFDVVDTSIPFLLYLNNMDVLGIYFNNITNQLVCPNSKSILIFCKWEPFWFFVYQNKKIIIGIFLIEVELHPDHTTHFGHPSANKLHKLLI